MKIQGNAPCVFDNDTEVLITDPCYVLSIDEWTEWCHKWSDPEHAHLSDASHIVTDDGLVVHLCSTKYGDGSYPFNGGSFAVDSGTFAVMYPKELAITRMTDHNGHTLVHRLAVEATVPANTFLHFDPNEGCTYGALNITTDDLPDDEDWLEDDEEEYDDEDE